MMDTFTPVFTFTCFYGGLSFAVYIGTVVMMYLKRTLFFGSYFMLYKANFFFNLVTFLNSFVALRVPQNTCKNCTLAYLFEGHSATNYSSFPLGIFYCTLFNMAYVQYSMIFIVSLNRFTMFYWLQRNDDYWRSFAVYIFLIVIIFPFTQTYPIITERTYYAYQADIDGYKSATEANLKSMLTAILFFMVISTIGSAVLNILSTRKLTKLKKTVKSQDRNLLYMSFFSFAIQLLAFIDTLVIQSGLAGDSFWGTSAKLLQPYVSDCLTLSQPWILLAFSSLSRREFVKLLIGKSKMEQVFTVGRNLDELQRSRSTASQVATI